jgi:glycosyltransferase involved in cell wall biosynthesis
MKILHVYKDYYPVLGGIENHVRLLCSELAKDKDIKVQVLVTNTGLRTSIQTLEGVKIIKAGRFGKAASTPISFSLFWWMKRLRPDIIHLHFPYPLGELATLFVGNYKRIVLTYHSDVIKQKRLFFIYKPFLRKLLNKIDIIIVSSNNYAQSSPILARYCHKIEILPFGIDIKRFEKRNERRIREIQEKFGSPLVLFVGKFRYYKGLQYLLEASKEVEAKFLLIGEGTLRSELERYVVKNFLQEKVYFLGEVNNDDLLSYYQASDVFVLPSSHRSEAFGISLLEAMSCQLPLVSTELGTGTSFVNLHNQTGVVVPPRNSKTLSQAINYLLTNKELRIKLGEAGRQRVESEFSKESMVERIKCLYRHVLGIEKYPDRKESIQ